MFDLHFKLNGDYFLYEKKVPVLRAFNQSYFSNYVKIELKNHSLEIYPFKGDFFRYFQTWVVDNQSFKTGKIEFWKKRKIQAYIHILDPKFHQNYFQLIQKGLFSNRYVLLDKQGQPIFEFSSKNLHPNFFPNYSIQVNECSFPLHFYHEIMAISGFIIRYIQFCKLCFFLIFLVIFITLGFEFFSS